MAKVTRRDWCSSEFLATFPPNLSLRSSRTQKQSCRALKGLSVDMHFTWPRAETQPSFASQDNDSRNVCLYILWVCGEWMKPLEEFQGQTHNAQISFTVNDKVPLWRHSIGCQRNKLRGTTHPKSIRTARDGCEHVVRVERTEDQGRSVPAGAARAATQRARPTFFSLIQFQLIQFNLNHLN